MNFNSIQKPYLFSENGGIGDAYVQLPMLRALNQIFNGRLTILTSEFNKNLYAAENFGKVIVFKSEFVRLNDRNTFVYELSDLEEILSDADCFIDTNGWTLKERGYENFISSRTYPTIGFFPFFEYKVYPDYTIHSFDLAFNFAKQVDSSLKIEDFAYPPKIGANVESFINQVRIHFEDDIILIGIQDETKKEKMWPSEHFEAIINLILAKYSNVAILILGKKSTIDLANITEKERVLYFEKSFDFPSLNGLMTLLDYFIGIDSVFLHLADFHKIPSIALFGPTNNKEWGLRFTKGVEIVSPTGNMADITVSEVADCFDKMIEIM